ncbi:FAD binding domain-containing protein [Flavihumibacter profundi]|jgi:aerobic carbon-monoxide dehydrogenase medium subunit|uniref:FAD binding domain-containing protein n=1 Tax=Flavihumibacter profundi TaxID=2716883 RepID=UPI001CC6ECDF|nr:xanthine dehydrogenase family protein subunit M [Flavihumibacter profundi]MBZ5858338.1 xanthine dehydrogenase family protein subunit M [Flavihumibacter profundi]
MIPQSFQYESPGTLEEAIKLLHQYGEEAKILSGGHSLIPMMKLRFATPEVLVDINNIPGLSHIVEENGKMKIGGLTRESELEHSAALAKIFPIFKDVTKLIADPQVRNRGTIGGNLAHGDAANDHPAVMLALNATVIATGAEGSREIPIDEFFFGFYSTALQFGEILTEIQIPIPPTGTGSAYHKLERKVGDYATAGVAVQITIGDDGIVKAAGIGLTNVNPTPLRAVRSEQALIGKPLTEHSIAEAALYASEDCSPSADLRGSEEYKRAMVAVLVKRMIHEAANRASNN